MISKHKKYFTLFGILSSSVDSKMQSYYCAIDSVLSLDLPKITKLLLSKVLKPVKLYSTNNI